MIVGVLGSGGREHSICDTLIKSEKIDKLYCLPGNAGTAKIATNVNLDLDNFENLIGDDAKFNAEKMMNIFKGEDNDFSKAVCLNAAAGLIVNETHQNFFDAYNDSREHILSTKVIKHIEKIQND